MDFNFVSIIGLIAGGCTTLAVVPQILKIFRTKSTRDISLGTSLITFIGLVFWTLYGIALKQPPIIFANGVSLVLVGAVLGYKLKYK
ncbi:MAG: SemiSWEET transporter [Chitinivibrionales bacterium]|nr:SemiSWEET transporter [Chitinivibrionales bacterium]